MLKPYPRYRDSGVEWIGEIPEGWVIKRLKYCTHKIQTGSTPKSNIIRYYKNGKISWFTPVSYNEGEKYLKVSPKMITEDAVNENESKLYKAKSILLVGIGATIGKVAMIKEKSSCNQQINIIEIKRGYPSFYYYNLKLYEKEIIKFASFTTLPILNQSNTGQLQVYVPPISEQKIISTYLDKKTKQIDTLIEKKEKMIELLKEKRVAVINHAVTKGLDPNVKMKDSGIEWIGEIPEGWELRKIRHLFKIKKRIAGELGHDVLSITQKGVKIKNISKNDGQLSSNYSKYQFVYIGDFAMNHMDLLTGYIDISKYNGVTSPDYRVFSLSNNQSIAKFFLYIFQLCYKRKIFYALGQGAAQFGRWRLPAKEFLEFRLPLPSKDEQILITDYINKKTKHIDTLIEKEKVLIEMFKKYRTALISEVVTGKVDLRDYEKVVN